MASKRILRHGISSAKTTKYGESKQSSFEKVKEFVNGAMKHIEPERDSGK